MLRFTLRRLALIPLILLLVNFLGFAYAHLALPARLARTPYIGPPPEMEPLLPAYGEYLSNALRLDFGVTRVGRERLTITETIGTACVSSLGLAGLALALSALLGLFLGVLAARAEPRGVARWFTLVSSPGLAMPSFYIGNLLILGMLTYVILSPPPGRSPLPVYGFGWDLHLVLPLLALLFRPTMQTAQITAGLLVEELGKRYVVTARSIGRPWGVIRWVHALRNALSSAVVALAGSARVLMAELILVEWLFGWPGLGRLLAKSLIPPALTTTVEAVPLFLNSTVVATVLTAFALVFLVVDLISALIARAVDPRLRAPEEGIVGMGAASSQAAPARRNWHLILGSAVVLLVVLTAAIGPALAPHDPLLENPVIRVSEDEWNKPPLRFFEVPGYPLGTDQYGRDTLSRILWGIHPTLIIVTIVALVRLILGAAIGMLAGWSGGRLGQILDIAITGALSLPVLIVALVVIAAVGIEAGIPAFILGLAVTGWGESARLVREQTRLIKAQQHIEAARALGGSDVLIVLRHVLPHLLPVLGMLLALEISATLITTAGLGFLGYYIGGDIWTSIEDRIARRLSGTPELGQILAESSAAATGLYNPWPMFAAGTLVFVAILGFNMLGEGLRRQLNLERGGRETIISRALRHVSWWSEERLWQPLSAWLQRRPRLAAAGGLAILAIVAALITWGALAARVPLEPGVALQVPGGHLWASTLHDPYGTLQIEGNGPADPTVLWSFQDPSGFPVGPMVAADGTLYTVSGEGTLYALTPGGRVRWRTSLPADPAGSLALGPEGNIYVPVQEGTLAAFSSEGKPLWQFQPEGQIGSYGTPIVGPDGTIYCLLARGMVALRPDGTLLWQAPIPAEYSGGFPRLNPTGEWIFWYADGALQTQDGGRLDLQAPIEGAWYITGADGRPYLLAGNTVGQWRWQASGVEMLRRVTLDVFRLGLPSYAIPDGAQVTSDEHVWMYYGWRWPEIKIAWLDLTGRVLSTVRHELFAGWAVAIDAEETIYSCGLDTDVLAEAHLICLASSPRSQDPVWEVQLERPGRLPDANIYAGGALVPGRLYVATYDGFLYAIGDE